MIDYDLLVLQNPWWKNREEIDSDPKIKEFGDSKLKYYPKEVLNLKLKPEAINILSGPRQTGKSTAIKLLIKKLLSQKEDPKNILYFNCDALDSKKDLIDLVLNFTKETASPNYIFLDEISSVPDWPYAIKWLADAGQLANSKIILTGSSSINLKKSGEFLPGRRRQGKDIRFLPIDFLAYFKLLNPQSKNLERLSFPKIKELQQELILKNINLKTLYKDYLLTGGFLKLINLKAAGDPLFEAANLYVSTLKSELAKSGKKEINARQVIKKIILSLTSETSYANIAEEAELGSKNTAAEYLNFLKDSFLLSETLFYSIPQKRVSIKKNKKFYPSDPALLWIFHSFVYGTPDIENFYQDYLKAPLDSRLAEAFVAGELYKKDLEICYFRNAHELDFYLPKLDSGIEVKYKDKVTTADLSGLKPASKKILISKNTLEKRDGVLIIPTYLFGFLKI